MPIPKVIHYCWFGGNPKPKLAEKCIASWKKYCPDYEIIEWNESNFDISTCPRYVQQAYEAQKWAFVTDYIRLQIIYENGGIYLDTDVELLKSFDPLLEYKAFFGIQNSNDCYPFYINTGVGFGAEKSTEIIKEIMADYTNADFYISKTEYDQTSCPVRNNPIFISHGFNSKNENQTLESTIHVFSSEYFCPVCFETKQTNITENTYSIHHYAASWITEAEKKKHKKVLQAAKKMERKHFIQTLPNRIVKTIIGSKNYDKLKKRLK